MKKKYILFALVSILGFASCSSINNNDAHKDNPVIENFDLNQVLLKELNDNEVLLNLTVNGLYNGEKGLSSEDYYLENYVIANLNVGDDLPTSEITSTVADCEFTSWQYATSGGELAFVSKVQEGQKYYQAYFTYLGEGQDDETIGGDGNLSSEQPLEDRTIYVKNNAGWSTVNLYAWNNNGRSNGSWPGLAMTYNEAIDLYTYELSPIYTSLIFNNGSSQTADLNAYTEVNTYIVNEDCTVSYGWYENGSITPVTPGDPINPGIPEGSSYVYFDLNGQASWTSVYVYTWEGADTGTWPGSKMAYDSETGYYKYSLGNASTCNIIFNNGSGEQTADLVYNVDTPLYTLNGSGGFGGVWTVLGADVEEVEKQNNYVYVNLNGQVSWSNVYVYTWSGASTGSWPGNKMSYDSEKGLYYYELGNVITCSIIFNDGNGAQTADLSYSSATPVFTFTSASNGTWSTLA